MTKSRGLRAPRTFWTEAERALLTSMYPDCHSADVAAWLDCSTTKVYQAAARFGVLKSPEYLASDTACRIQRGKQHPSMIATRFKAGQASWSKGLRGVVGVQEACRATQFKPGRLPSEARNYKPIGSMRVSKDGYLERKLTDDPAVYPARRWVAVHRIVWEAEHGPIPAGHIVRFKPGQITTDVDAVTADRLECITRLENMRRNSVHAVYPPEVARLVQLRGALNRQINRRQQESNP